MKLTFGKHRVLASDDKNLEIQELVTSTPKIGVNKGTEVSNYQFRGYHSNLRSVLLRLAELQINVDEEIPALITKLDELKEWIKKEVLPCVPKLEKSGKRGRATASEDFELIVK